MILSNLTFEKEGHVTLLSINRPKALNALNTELLKELDWAIGQIEEDSETYVVIITGVGEKAFVAGADISEMKEFGTTAARAFSTLGNKIFRRLETLSVPTIAAVNGFALGGGCELALACDIRIGTEKSKFGLPETGLGITPGFGGTQRLARAVGEAKAKEMIFTGVLVNGQEALQIGLVNKVVAVESLMTEARQMAVQIASKAPIAIRLAKSAVSRGLACDIDTGVAYEAEVFAQCFATADQKEGMSAFLEKREKTFINQ